jgi:hypothetical protein
MLVGLDTLPLAVVDQIKIILLLVLEVLVVVVRVAVAVLGLMLRQTLARAAVAVMAAEQVQQVSLLLSLQALPHQLQALQHWLLLVVLTTTSLLLLAQLRFKMNALAIDVLFGVSTGGIQPRQKD